MYNWTTLLYTWNKHNIVKQLYSNKRKKNKKSVLVYLEDLAHTQECMLTVWFMVEVLGCKVSVWPLDGLEMKVSHTGDQPYLRN